MNRISYRWCRGFRLVTLRVPLNVGNLMLLVLIRKLLMNRLIVRVGLLLVRVFLFGAVMIRARLVLVKWLRLCRNRLVVGRKVYIRNRIVILMMRKRRLIRFGLSKLLLIRLVTCLMLRNCNCRLCRGRRVKSMMVNTVHGRVIMGMVLMLKCVSTRLNCPLLLNLVSRVRVLVRCRLLVLWWLLVVTRALNIWLVAALSLLLAHCRQVLSLLS